MWINGVAIRALWWWVHKWVGRANGRERLGVGGDGWQRRHLSRRGRVVLGGDNGWEVDPTRRLILEDDMECDGGLLLFGTSEFTPCPVVLECLQCTGTNTLEDPTGVKNDFALLTGILAK